jgi:cbb3-type cytochrome oxidase subunit 3
MLSESFDLSTPVRLIVLVHTFVLFMMINLFYIIIMIVFKKNTKKERKLIQNCALIERDELLKRIVI